MKRYESTPIATLAQIRLPQPQAEGDHVRQRANHRCQSYAVTFQLYRLDLHADTIETFQGKRLDEISIHGSSISATDTVAMIKERIRPWFQSHVKVADRVTFHFSRKRMLDDALFYIDHYMQLPVWVQIGLHDGPPEDVDASIHRLTKRPDTP